MQIELHNIGKHFNKKWIFRGINLNLLPDNTYGIIGQNGSGKSTLLKIIGNILDISEGNVVYRINQVEIKRNIYKNISFATPYHALIEEFTLYELLKFHFKFKDIIDNLSIDDLIVISQLETHKNKAISTFSTGMKQRIKLLMAFASRTSVILLDEPTTNLDANSIEWFYSLINKYRADRTIVICSNNNEKELTLCKTIIDINEYKKSCD